MISMEDVRADVMKIREHSEVLVDDLESKADFMGMKHAVFEHYTRLQLKQNISSAH